MRRCILAIWHCIWRLGFIGVVYKFVVKDELKSVNKLASCDSGFHSPR